MNREDIIRMAQEAGFYIEHNEIYSMSTQSDHELTEPIERFAKLVAQHEREACAKACEEVYTGEEASCDWPTPEMCATAIRARGQA
jgi:hypothetical protein